MSKRTRTRHPIAYRAQRRVPGGRDALPSCVLKSIRAAVEREAARNGVSKSFVVAVALARAFNISDQERY